ncbi:hypothetical protein Bca4012_069076 [Brassica carinata]
MTVIDILTRVDSICKKYDKYDVDKQREANVSGDDAFARLYGAFETQIETALEKAELVTKEKNRASAVAMNAEIRRTKARLSEEVPKLQRLAVKRVSFPFSSSFTFPFLHGSPIMLLLVWLRFLFFGMIVNLRRERENGGLVLGPDVKVKGLTTEELAARNDLVLALPARIEAIPDGTAGGPKATSAWAPSTASRPDIKFDSDGRFDDDYFQESHESSQFRQEFEMRKIKQASLDMISEGLDALKNMASDMNEELDRQVPLMDEIDSKVDRATSDLRNTNVRLKHTVNQLRSSRNFCIDIVLLCIVLGIAAYLYNVLK